MSQHAESTQLLLCFHGFHDLVSNANTDVCVLHQHKRPPQGLQSVSNATKNGGVTTILTYDQTRGVAQEVRLAWAVERPKRGKRVGTRRARGRSAAYEPRLSHERGAGTADQDY